MRALVATLAALLWSCGIAEAEWQIKPFAALTFGGTTEFVDPDDAVGTLNPAIGVGGVLLGDVFGVEGELTYAPGFFQTGDGGLVQDSGVTTVTGSLLVALPRRLAAYTLRPYFAVGGGLMRVAITGVLGGVEGSSHLPALEVGGGVTGFFTDRIGVSWDMRYFRSHRRTGVISDISSAGEQLSFWRAAMALALRY
jgi:hypothetical protein